MTDQATQQAQTSASYYATVAFSAEYTALYPKPTTQPDKQVWNQTLNKGTQALISALGTATALMDEDQCNAVISAAHAGEDYDQLALLFAAPLPAVPVYVAPASSSVPAPAGATGIASPDSTIGGDGPNPPGH